MNLYLRLFYFIIKHWGKHDLKPLDSSALTFRVLPNDLDINMHMNNGRYLTIMDIGRLDLLNRTGILGTIMSKRWLPNVGSASINFLRPLKPFQKYELHTRIAHWDEKWFYLEQTFYSNNKTVAEGKIKGLLRGKEGNISPLKILQLADPDIKDIAENTNGTNDEL